ncbi:MAG: acyl-ACP--UDP-N-acetylglucosamine O-acyltransferase [Parachlamydiales bacterium]|jgi:UDP-N-acetylglucosamine acyltransferase
MSDIHPLAYVEKGAQIAQNVTIEPFATVKKNVILKAGAVIRSHAYLDGYTTIGERSVVFPGAAIGLKPQDLKYKGEKTFVEIGQDCSIREYVTINASCQEGSTVKVGDGSLIMAYCHLAHNCTVGKKVIMANGVQLAGHVQIEDYAVIGGMTPVHQFCRIGSYAMVGGFSAVSHDVPPYMLGAGYPFRLGGLNLVGLKRHRFSLEVRVELAKAFRLIYRSGLGLQKALKEMEKLQPFPEIVHLIEFCLSSKRGLIDLGGIVQRIPENRAAENKTEELLDER